jgi:hypothetical protein
VKKKDIRKIVAEVSVDEMKPYLNRSRKFVEAHALELARRRGLNTTKPFEVILNYQTRSMEYHQEEKFKAKQLLLEGL